MLETDQLSPVPPVGEGVDDQAASTAVLPDTSVGEDHQPVEQPVSDEEFFTALAQIVLYSDKFDYTQ